MNLRPGEIKILKALSKGEKSYSQLKEETKLNFTFLSNYLKNLQKLNLVEKNIDNRKYRIKEFKLSFNALLIDNLLNFLKEEMKINFLGFIPIITNDNNLAKQIINLNSDNKFKESLEYIENEIRKTVEKYALSFFKNKKREIIEKYIEYEKEIEPIIAKGIKDTLKSLKSIEFFDFFELYRKIREKTLKEKLKNFNEEEKKKIKFLENEKNKKIFNEYALKICSLKIITIHNFKGSELHLQKKYFEYIRNYLK